MLLRNCLKMNQFGWLLVLSSAYLLNLGLAQITSSPASPSLDCPNALVTETSKGGGIQLNCTLQDADGPALTWSPVEITATVTGETVIHVVNKYNNKTRTETITNANLTRYKPTSVDSRGTRLATISVWDGSQSIMTTLAFPTGIRAYGTTYKVYGVISTITDGKPSCVTGDYGRPANFTLPSNPPPPSVTPTAIVYATSPEIQSQLAIDPQGWTFTPEVQLKGENSDWWKVIPPLFPNLKALKCKTVAALPLVPQATALYLTHTTTSTDTGHPDSVSAIQSKLKGISQSSPSSAATLDPDDSQAKSTTRSAPTTSSYTISTRAQQHPHTANPTPSSPSFTKVTTQTGMTAIKSSNSHPKHSYHHDMPTLTLSIDSHMSPSKSAKDSAQLKPSPLPSSHSSLTVDDGTSPLRLPPAPYTTYIASDDQTAIQTAAPLIPFRSTFALQNSILSKTPTALESSSRGSSRGQTFLIAGPEATLAMELSQLIGSLDNNSKTNHASTIATPPSGVSASGSAQPTIPVIINSENSQAPTAITRQSTLKPIDSTKVIVSASDDGQTNNHASPFITEPSGANASVSTQPIISVDNTSKNDQAPTAILEPSSAGSIVNTNTSAITSSPPSPPTGIGGAVAAPFTGGAAQHPNPTYISWLAGLASIMISVYGILS